MIRGTDAEAALRASDARNTAIMEAALDTIVVMDHEGTIIDVNRAVEKTFGYRREDIIGLSLADVLVPPQYRERHREGLARYLRTGESVILGKRVELEALRADGSVVPVEITIVRIHTEGPPLFTGYLRDITERRATAKALRLSEERFRRLADSGIVGLLVAHAEQGVVVEANDAFLGMVGYTRQDLEAGMITADALNFPEWEAGQQDARRQFAETGAVRAWEKEYRRKDGTRLPVLTAVTSIELPHILTVVLDLSPQRRAEEAARTLRELREQDATIRELLDAAPDAMVIVDAKGKISLVNVQAERMFGYRRDELLGQSVEVLVPQRFRPVRSRYREGFFGDPRGRATGAGVDLFALRKDGSEFPVEISLSPLTTKEGTLVSGAIRDVTERRRADQELRRAKDAAETAMGELEAFSYSVAHDLRAPLRAINGFSVALQEDCADKLDVEARSYLGRISNGAIRMGHLIDALLLLARVSRTEPTMVPVDMSSLASVVASQLQTNEPRPGAEIVIANGLSARGDPSLLRAVFENLLGNAWKFGAKRERLRIEVGSREIDGGIAAYFVSDNGAGFDMEYITKLFTPFQRLHGVSEFPGTGIGLATVERIVRRHGGRVWAEGAVDQGATFYFTLQDPRGVGP